MHSGAAASSGGASASAALSLVRHDVANHFPTTDVRREKLKVCKAQV